MGETKTCPECGAVIAEGDGHCPRCMLRAGLGEESRMGGQGHAFEGDRNLLFGVFAVQLRKVTPQEVMAAAGAWAADASKDLPTRLKEQSILSQADVEFIARLVDEAVRAHGGDVEATLNTLGGAQVLQATFGNSIDLSRHRYGAAGSPVYLDGTIDPDSVPGVQETPGRYTHVSEHARGGMGRVLLVHDGFLGRNVALKELMPGQKPTSDPENPSTPVRQYMGFLSRFLQEARITGQLEHPSIVPVYELGHRQDGTLYYTMKLVRGKTLREAITQSKAIQERLALLAHFIDLCQAVAYAHSRGIVHRDIKPDNVMVGEFGETVVLDWGLAKSKDREDCHADGLAETIRMLQLGDVDSALKTQYGQVMGTPGYMSPEQALGRITEVDEKSDVYSLGAVLYQMLAGRPPFTGKSVPEILRKVVDDDPEPLDTMIVPPELAAICNKAMSKRAESRYPSASAMAEEVRRFQTGAIVQAYSYGFGHHLKRFAKRHKAVLTTAAAALLAIMALAGYSYFNIRQARDVAETKRIEAETAKEESDKRREAEEAARKQAEHNAYVSGIRAAKADLDDHNAESVRRQLLATPAQLRNWEWGYLYKAMDTSLFTLAYVKRATYSPDGKRIVAACNGGVARIYDAETGNMVFDIKGHSGSVNDAHYSADGKRIVTASGDQTARVWDAETGDELITISGHNEEVDTAQFSPDGRLLLTTTEKSIKVWNLQTGQEAYDLHCVPEYLTMASFSMNGKSILACLNLGNGLVAKVWDSSSGAGLFETPLHGMTASLSSDGSVLVTLGDYDDRSKGTEEKSSSGFVTGSVLNGKTGKPLHPLIARHSDGLRTDYDLAIDKQGKRIAASTFNTSIKVFDAQTGIELHTLTGHISGVTSVTFSSDGRYLASAGDRTIRVWDVDTGKELAALAGLATGIYAAEFNPNGSQLLAITTNNTAKVWNWRSRSTSPPKWQLAVSPDGKRLCGRIGDAKNAYVWDLATEKQICKLSGHESVVELAEFSPNGRQVFTMSRDGSGRLWDAQTGIELLKMSGDDFIVSLYTRMEFDPIGEHIVINFYDHKKVYSLVTGQELNVPGFQSYSWDGKRILTFSEKDGLRLLDASTLDVVVEFGESKYYELSGATFSRDGSRIAAFDEFRTATKVWDANSGHQLLALTGWVQVFSPDGKYLCGLDYVADNRVTVWKAADGVEVCKLLGHLEDVSACDYSPDGERIVTCSGSAVKVWNASSGDELLSLEMPSAILKPEEVSLSTDGISVFTKSRANENRIWTAAPWRHEDWLDETLRGELVRLAMRQAPEARETMLDRSKGDVEPVLAALESFASSIAAAPAKVRPALRAIKGQGIYFSEAPVVPVPGITLNAEDVVVSIDGYALASLDELTKRITDFVAAVRADRENSHLLEVGVVNAQAFTLQRIEIPVFVEQSLSFKRAQFVLYCKIMANGTRRNIWDTQEALEENEHVLSNTDAAPLGLEGGDVLLYWDGQDVTNSKSLIEQLESHGQTAKDGKLSETVLTVWRPSTGKYIRQTIQLE